MLVTFLMMRRNKVEVNKAYEHEINLCKSCKSPNVMPGYSIPLCQECREKFIHYPIPIKIKIASILIFVIVAISLISFPKSINAGIQYERGEVAKNENKYYTAMLEYEKLLDT